MKLLKLFAAFLFLFSFALAPSTFAQKKAHKYVGTKKCGMCHRSKKRGGQYQIWKASAHAKAYKTLQTKEADKISMKQDGKKAVDNPKCLKCHATGYNVAKSLLTKSFKIEDGVQCETCHGPGSDYKKMSVMKNKKKAIAAGLKMYADPGNELCVKCHNPESPFYKKFNFEKFWAKIKHPLPKK